MKHQLKEDIRDQYIYGILKDSGERIMPTLSCRKFHYSHILSLLVHEGSNCSQCTQGTKKHTLRTQEYLLTRSLMTLTKHLP